MARVIKLSGGLETIVDDDMYDYLMQWRWYATVDPKLEFAYARRSEWIPSLKTNKAVMMHHEVLPREEGKVTDHINGNKLDNRRKNLRNVTIQQNCYNSGPFKSGKVSKYKGVRWRKDVGRWVVQISNKSTYKYVGYFDDEREAALAYNAAALEVYGEYARLNEVK